MMVEIACKNQKILTIVQTWNVQKCNVLTLAPCMIKLETTNVMKEILTLSAHMMVVTAKFSE